MSLYIFNIFLWGFCFTLNPVINSKGEPDKIGQEGDKRMKREGDGYIDYWGGRERVGEDGSWEPGSEGGRGTHALPRAQKFLATALQWENDTQNKGS